MEIVLDIETIPGQNDWIKDHISKDVKPPGNIKKQEIIDAWYAEKRDSAVEEALEKTVFDGAMNHIVCIGVSVDDADPVSFSAKTVEGEKTLLVEFYAWLKQNTGRADFDIGAGNIYYIGHNISGFDLRVIRQRSIVLGVAPISNIPFHSKPWDMNPFDTMIQWDAKNFTKLDVLAKAFGIEGKGDMDGSQVYQYWKDGRHDEIASYCRDDVRMTREVYKHMRKVM